MSKHEIEVIYLDKKNKVAKKLLSEILERLIKAKNIKGKVVISLVQVNNKIIKELNSKFRNKNETTSVLSLPLNTKFPFITPKKSLFLGDIILNIQKIKRENKDFKKTIKENIIHSFLHLLSFNHNTARNEQKMKNEEKRLLGVLNDI